MKILMILIGLTGFLLTGGIVMAYSLTEEGHKEGKIRHYERLYEMSSEKQPTPENLKKSLDIVLLPKIGLSVPLDKILLEMGEDIRPHATTELISALNLIRLRDIGVNDNDEELTAKILSCYENNPNWELVRVVSARSLIHVNREKGIELSRTMFRNPKTSLEFKLRLARNMVMEGVLLGYPVLREGLLTPNDYRRRIALALLENFRPYDGEVCERSGEKIDISGLVTESKKKAQQILEDLEAIEGIDQNEKVDKE